MSARNFLAELYELGIKVWVDNDHLCYRAPKGIMTPSLLAKLAEHKTELLMLFSQHQKSDLALPQIIPAPDQLYQPFPITDVQQAYWLGRHGTFELGNVGNHGYIEVEAVDLDLDRFLLILRQLIERHPMLRAILLPDGRQQILERVPPYQIELINLEGLDQQTINERIDQIRREMDHNVFQAGQWPVFEIRISCLDKRHRRVHVSMEALFIDAWSIGILFREFLHLYYESEASLPPLELSFRDYILAVEQLRDTELFRRSQDYWTKRLGELPAAPDLPLAIKPAELQQPHFIPRKARLEALEWQQLKARGAQMGLTPSGILLAAFAEILTTWSKSPRFCINLTTFNLLPLHKQVHEIMGDFTSLLLLAVDNSHSDVFERRARRLQEQLWHDFDHCYYNSIRVIQDIARIKGDKERIIMPVVFTSLLGQEIATTYPAPWQETIYFVTQTPQVWLDHQVMEEAGSLVVYWQAVEALFPPGLLDDMFDAYIRFLHRLTIDDEVWQSHSCDLIPTSQLAVRALINATEAPVSERLLQSFCLEQAVKNPNQLAVISAGRSLTYQEVLNRATRLGHQLRQLGARPNHLIAVVMEKGWEQVIGVLGILLSGAAYLPIDPKLPRERMTFLLDHGEVELVITQSWIARTVQWPERLKVIEVDAFDQCDVSPSAEIQYTVPCRPDDLAYVIYTSGSTGLPKGVMIDHRGAVNTILDINHRFGVTSEDRVLALSALHFDLSVYDIFGILAAGGTIVMPAEKALRDPSAWANLLVQERVTLWNTVPALLEMLIEYREAVCPEALNHSYLRLACLSGDWIPITLPDRLRKFMPAVQIISLGGATEASIWSVFYPITIVDAAWKSIPYGQPLANQSLYVLNERLEPCPVWVPGQLFIAGIGLAKGYWRDEGRTKASFFEHPQTGIRLYRTGDRGRYLPDGTIEFLGREDTQVKVQGHRIELGEIEATLTRHPIVQAAVATVVTEPHEEKRLVAYVVLQREQANNNGHDLSSFLGNQEANESSLREGSHTSPISSSDDKSQYEALQRLSLQFSQRSIRNETNKPVIDVAHSTTNIGVLRKYRQRLSYRKFLEEPISFKQLREFLGSLSQIELEGLPKYLYPSASGIYPIQTYISIKPQRIEGVPEGIYYYNPQSYQLVMFADNAYIDRNIHRAINRAIFDESAFSLFLIGDLAPISSLYGESAKDFCMLEAGYMSQLLMMTAAEYQIGLCPIGDLDFEQIRDVFVLGENHLLLHSLLGGRVDPSVATGWSFLPGDTEKAPLQRPVEPRETSTETARELSRFLKEKLPEYMVPSAIIVLNSLPLTANGKIDRKHLPLPEIQSSRKERAYREPTSEIERKIAAVWEEVLALEKVDLHDNFFNLGGNSLLMIQAYAKLCKLLACDISLIEMFFQYPTIHALAQFITKEQPIGIFSKPRE